MIIARRSMLTGMMSTRDLPVTQAQLNELELPGQLRRPIQDIFPDLSAGDREFLKTGVTEEEWAAAFPEG